MGSETSPVRIAPSAPRLQWPGTASCLTEPTGMGAEVGLGEREKSKNELLYPVSECNML